MIEIYSKPTTDDSRDSDSGRPIGPLAALLMAGWLLAAAPAMAAPYGFSVSYGNLLRLDLATGDADVVGPTGLESSVHALTVGPGGALFGLGAEAGATALVRLDPATGAGEVVSPLPSLPLIGTSGIAATGDGALWVVAGQDLYRVDAATGTAAPPITLPESVGNLASRGGELFGFAPGDRFQRINTTSGALVPVFTFEDLGWTVIGASFDDDGELRFLAISGGILTLVPLAVYHVADLDAGTFEQTFAHGFHFGDFRAGMQSLALPAVESVVEVPALGPTGLAALGLLILLAGVAMLRRAESRSRRVGRT